MRPMKIFADLEETGGGMKEKTHFSTSIPKVLKDSLDNVNLSLRREKATIIRTALTLFLKKNLKDQETIVFRVLKTDQANLEPFSTTLFREQVEILDRLAKDMGRAKTLIFRAAVFDFVKERPEIQEREIRKYLDKN